MNKLRPGRFFTMYSKEHSGAFVLLILAIVIALVPAFISNFRGPVIIDHAQDSAEIAALLQQEKTYNDSIRRAKRRNNFWLHDKKDLEKLGIRGENAEKIFSEYRQGRIRDFADLANKSGMDSANLRRIWNHSVPVASPLKLPIELNTADSAELVQLKGIGAKTAQRILNYRKKLGGFYNSRQLLEVYYIDTTVIKGLLSSTTADPTLINKVKISEVNRDALIAHPYLTQKQAGLLLAYAREHNGISESEFNKLPYLSRENREKLIHYLILR